MKPTKTSGILIIENARVLLVRHREDAKHMTGAYGIPAGRLEGGETAMEQAIMELEEETGLITTEENLELLPEIYKATIDRKDGPQTFTLQVFVCTHYTGTLRASEQTTPEWIELAELPHINLLPNMDLVIQDGLEVL